MRASDDPRFERVPDGEEVPWTIAAGWYRPAAHPAVRIAGDVEIGPDAVISGSARISGGETYGFARISGGEISGGAIYGGEISGGEISGGEIYGGVISGGAMVGLGIHATAVRWVASVCKPGVVKIGCEEHLITEWLADDPVCQRIPWDDLCTPEERVAIQQVVRAMAAQEALGNTWATPPNETKRSQTVLLVGNSGYAACERIRAAIDDAKEG